MRRTQIQLTEEQAERLRAKAIVSGRSLADLIRESVDVYLSGSGALDQEELRHRALAAIGRFRSGLSDLGTRHDDHLFED